MEDMKNENNENISEQSAADEENVYAYKSVLKGNKNSRLYSVISLASSALSVLFAFLSLSWIALILSALGIVFAIVSRKNLGYFDNISLWGLIIGIFGAVFSVMSFIFAALFSENESYKSFVDSLFGKKN